MDGVAKLKKSKKGRKKARGGSPDEENKVIKPTEDVKAVNQQSVRAASSSLQSKGARQLHYSVDQRDLEVRARLRDKVVAVLPLPLKTGMKTFLLKLLLLGVCTASLHVAQGYVAAPLIGYQQGVTIQITPSSSTNDQCTIYGIPTPTGYADRAAGPLFLYTPKNTGGHVLSFAWDTNSYYLDPILSPGQTTLEIDATNQQNPLITFDANRSPQGQSGAVTVYLRDKSSGGALCYVNIQLTVDPPLSCLPTYGGIGGGGGGGGGFPPSAGNFIIPGGAVYAPTYVTTVIIQQFTVINNININIVVNNVVQITNINVVKNITVVPPTPAPVNCTATPTNPACAKTPTSPITPSRQPPAGAPPPTTPVARPPNSPPTGGPPNSPPTPTPTATGGGNRPLAPPPITTSQAAPPTTQFLNSPPTPPTGRKFS